MSNSMLYSDSMLSSKTIMKISDNISLTTLAVYLEKQKALILSDIHIGYEEALIKQGMMVPRVYFKHLYEKTKNLLKQLNPNIIIINGDLKHEFGRISETEWRHTIRFLDLFKGKEVYLIKGNHDKQLDPIAERRDVQLVPYHIIDHILITHGDKILDTKKIEKKHNAKIKTIIIGHEHPAISLRTQVRSETYKCFLIGKYKRKELIVMPSFNEITYGSDIFQNDVFSPYLKSNTGKSIISNFNVIIYGKKLYDFGKVKDIKKRCHKIY